METQPTKSVKKEMGTKETANLPKIIIITVVFLIVIGVIGFVVYQQKQTAKLEAAYQEAISIMEAGDYERAVNFFMELDGYKDSQEMIQKCYDTQSLEYLQSLYQAINVIYQIDNKLVDIVSDVMRNLDQLRDVPFMSPIDSIAMSNLYSGQGYRTYHESSGYEAAQIQAVVPSAQISKGRMWYDVYIPVFSAESAQLFVDSIESANDLMKDLSESFSDIEDVSAANQEIQEQLLLTYEALKEYHSFAANEPTDYENYKTTARQKKAAVNDSLNNLPPTVKASN